MSIFINDIKFAFRQLVKSPGLTVVVILILALGIGANTTIFSVINALLLQPLPFDRPNELVFVWDTNPGSGLNQFVSTGPNYLDWRRQNQVFQNMGAMTVGQGILRIRDESLPLSKLLVSPSFFRTLGVQPVMGRIFSPEEDQPGKQNVLVLSHTLWQGRFQGATDIIGQTVVLDGQPQTVIGVLGPHLGFLDRLGEAFVPLPLETLRQHRGSHLYVVMARLKSDTSIVQAQTGMQTIAEELARAYPDKNKGWGIRVMGLRDQIAVIVRPIALGGQGLVLFVLLIVCVNTATLTVGRASLRSKEIAIRLALGSNRLRIIQQVLTESVLLAVLGGAAGLLLSWVGINIINGLLFNRGYHLWNTIRIDSMVMLFTLGLSVLAGCVFGLLPALHLSKPVLQKTLVQTARTITLGRSQRRLLSGLTIAEIGLTLVLLIGAGLLLRNLIMLQRIDPGFDPEHVLCAGVVLPESRYSENHQRAQFYKSAIERLQTLPRVQNVCITDGVPMSGHRSSWGFTIEGQEQMSGDNKGNSQFRRISTDYFTTLRISLIKGRFFNSLDREDSPPVLIINETMVRRFFPNSNPIGARVTIKDDARNPREIVGVVADERNLGLSSDPVPILYIPYQQGYWPMDKNHPFHFICRTRAAPLTLIAPLRSLIGQIDPELALSDVRSLEQLTTHSIGFQRSGTWLMGSFAVISLTLAMLGIYAVMAYAVNARKQEIGIRLALGARSSEVMYMILKRGFFLSSIGCTVGIILALGVTRFLSSILYGVSTLDVRTFCGASVFLTGVALLASYIPARRAAKIDPMEALRYE